MIFSNVFHFAIDYGLVLTDLYHCVKIIEGTILLLYMRKGDDIKQWDTEIFGFFAHETRGAD